MGGSGCMGYLGVVLRPLHGLVMISRLSLRLALKLRRLDWARLLKLWLWYCGIATYLLRLGCL